MKAQVSRGRHAQHIQAGGLEATATSTECLTGILYRANQGMNWRSPWMMLNFLIINAMHQRDVEGRNGLPLGDQNWHGQLLKARHAGTIQEKELVGGAL